MGVLGDTIMLFVVISGVSSVFVGHRCGKSRLRVDDVQYRTISFVCYPYPLCCLYSLCGQTERRILYHLVLGSGCLSCKIAVVEYLRQLKIQWSRLLFNAAESGQFFGWDHQRESREIILSKSTANHLSVSYRSPHHPFFH